MNSGSKELGRARNVPAFKTSLLFFFFFTAWNETRAWSTQDWGTSLTPLSLFLISQIQRQRTKNQNVPLPFCSFLPSGPKRQGPRGLSSEGAALPFKAPSSSTLHLRTTYFRRASAPRARTGAYSLPSSPRAQQGFFADTGTARWRRSCH